MRNQVVPHGGPHGVSTAKGAYEAAAASSNGTGFARGLPGLDGEGDGSGVYRGLDALVVDALHALLDPAAFGRA